MSDSYKAYIANIDDFHPDEENANRHTLRGRTLVHKGMKNRGYARPAFAAKDGTVLGGNLSTLDVAVDIGLGQGKVLVVETDGRLPIIHKRVDVEAGTEAARLLALEDNRTAEISLDWNPAVMVDFLGDGLDLSELWTPDELSVMLEGAADSFLVPDPSPQKEPELKSERFIEIYCSEKDLKDFQGILDEWSNRQSVTVNIS